MTEENNSPLEDSEEKLKDGGEKNFGFSILKTAQKFNESIDNTLSQFIPGIKKEKKSKDIIIIPKKEEVNIIDALRLVAPGTQLREALDDILKAKKGAIIVIATSPVFEIIEGGFKLNCKFTPQRLFELSKMDGAIILSSDLKKILYANSLLVPHFLIPSDETGTRHKSAERTAKHAKTLVIAISERKNCISLYYHNIKYSLRNVGEILNRTIEKLNVLDKQREIYNNLLSNLNQLEINNVVTTNDVASVLQRIEIILKISETIKREIIELGNEGGIVKIRFKELVKGIEKDKKLLLKDYTSDIQNKYTKEISKLNFDHLLDLSKISEITFNNMEGYIQPRGYRLFEKLDFQNDDVCIVINRFNNLKEIFDADLDALTKIFKNKEKSADFSKALLNLKENILMEKEI